MATLDYYLIDSFTSERFAGNPAAVVLASDDLTDDHMKRVAREFNISETTFVMESSTSEATIALRWFTPSTEVQMCGHGTIAAVHALVDSGRFTTLLTEKGLILPIQTANAVLTVRCEKMEVDEREFFFVWLDLPDPILKKKQIAPGLWADMLGVPQDAFDLQMPSMQTQDGDVLVYIRELAQLLDARPDFKELATISKQQHVRGWCLFTTNTLLPSIHVHSRFFAPAVGIDEDPVTGSVHGPLSAYLVSHGLAPMFSDAAPITATQTDSTGRAGLIKAVVVQEGHARFKVRIGGECAIVMKGKVFV